MILTLLSLIRALYPSPSCVAMDATRQSARNADYQHLQEPDLLCVRERSTGVTIQSDLEGILNLKAFSC